MMQDLNGPEVAKAVHADDYPLHSLDFTPQDQDRSDWCWAACKSMTFYGLENPEDPSERRQCAVAKKVLGTATDCCADPGACNKELPEADVEAAWEKYDGYKASYQVDRPKGFEVRDHIANNKSPIQLGFELDYPPGKGHLVIVDSYDEKSGKVCILDPRDSGVIDSKIDDVKKLKKKGLKRFQAAWLIFEK